MINDDIFDPIHLDIAFHRLQPELLLQNIRDKSGILPKTGYLKASSSGWTDQAYIHYVLSRNGLHRTDDEAQYMAEHFRRRMTSPDSGDSVFEMLRLYAQNLLTAQGNEPLCRYQQVLRWRTLSLSLGQDLLTTAFAAAEDIRNGRERSDFNWPAIIRTDNGKLGQLVARGVSENHFHLTGSTRLFSLSWACMMNHPGRIHAFFQDGAVREAFSERLNLAVSGNPTEKLIPWQELLLYAAFLRASLFTRCMDGAPNPEIVRKLDASPQKLLSETKDIVAVLRFSYGAKILQQNGRGKVLDYAITEKLDDYRTSHNRLLAGERHFLYRCFRNCYCGLFNEMEKDLFYLYLLIQNQFRSELVQVNERIGFQNFARYQDRKGLFWEPFPEYVDESIRLAVNATLQSGSVRSLEARICPAKTPKAQKTRIVETDRAYGFAETGSPLNDAQLDAIGDSPLFYVLHFPKNRKELYKAGSTSAWQFSAYAHPRNSKVRRDTEIQARSIAKSLQNSPYLRKRIRGIDACSNEIGCRPETFATEFRFLRSGLPCNPCSGGHADEKVRLFATYHAGEDFVDILDGLRAIDEAFLFLELGSGDRLGHALALGVNPRDYYNLKDRRLVLPKQELLDNLVWLLFKTQQYDIKIPQRLRETLEKRASGLMAEIGYGTEQDSLLTYYHAWHLRGDHPRVYQTGVCCPQSGQYSAGTGCETGFEGHPLWQAPPGSYESFYTQKADIFNFYRSSEMVRGLCRRYHYDADIKQKGREIVPYYIDLQIIPVVEALQNRMQHTLKAAGISIECNPSSNVLIGSFYQYCDHPMFRFNRSRIRVPRWEHEKSADLSISINTDDQGVFDTSLESEYACVALSMERETDDDGNRINSDGTIYDYLDYVRELGNRQTFHYKGSDIFDPDAEDYPTFCDHLQELGGDKYFSRTTGSPIL